MRLIILIYILLFSFGAQAQVSDCNVGLLGRLGRLQNAMSGLSFGRKPSAPKLSPDHLVYTSDPQLLALRDDLKLRLLSGDLTAWSEFLGLLSLGGGSFKAADFAVDAFFSLSAEVKEQVLHLAPEFRRRAKEVTDKDISEENARKFIDGKRLVDQFFSHAFRGDLIFKKAFDATGSSFEAYRIYMSEVRKYFGTPYSYLDVIEVARIIQKELLRAAATPQDPYGETEKRHDYENGQFFVRRDSSERVDLGGSFFNGRSNLTNSDIDAAGRFLSLAQTRKIQSEIKKYFDQTYPGKNTNINFENHTAVTMSSHFFGKLSTVAIIVTKEHIRFEVFEPGESIPGDMTLTKGRIEYDLGN